MKRNFSKLPELKVIKHKAEENPSKKKSYKLKPRRRTNPEKSEKAKNLSVRRRKHSIMEAACT